MFYKWWLSNSDTLVHLNLMLLGHHFSAEKMDYPFSASRHGCNGGRKHQSGNGIGDIVVHSRILVDNPSRSCLLYKFCFFILRWGCREHFVSGCCWHSSGRDRGRYPRECWLSTLGVLHPGVPVMWYGHIRDLFPTAEGCKGSRLPNVAMLQWAQQK